MPAEWSGELEVGKIAGMPQVQEHAILHVPSRTLIVADLFFNFGENASPWTRFVARRLMRLPEGRGMSPVFRSMIKNREVFPRSLRDIFAWDFDRIIVAHGEVIETGGKSEVAGGAGPSGDRFVAAL